MHVPVTRPGCVVGRAWHVRVRQSVRGPAAPLEKQMTDGGPRDRDGAALEDLQQHGDVFAFPTSLLSGHLLGMVAKSPTQLEVRGDTGRRSCVDLERRDRDTVE